MPTHAGPKQAAKENLIFAIDAADKKNSILPSSTILNMSSWTLGSGGIGAYSRNGDTAENERVLGTDPYGRTSIVWETRPSGNDQADGGWNTSYFSVNTAYTYRYSVWVKRTSSTSGGTFYLGMNPNPIRNDNNLSQANPYFTYPATSTLTQNQWYLVVSHVFYEGYSEGKRHPDSGWYENGIKISDKNTGNIGSLDSRWATGTTTARHRTYHYYCPNNTTNLQFFDPRMDMCDGTEPSISDLLKLSPSHTTSLIGNRSARLTNGTIWSRNNQGTFVLDGTNDYIDLGSSLSSLDTSILSIELVFKTNASATSANILLGWMENESTHGYICLGNFTGHWSDEVISFYNEGAASTSLSFAYTTGPNLQDMNYHHVIFILQTGGYKIYVDGNEVPVNASFRNGSMSTTMPSNLFGYGSTPSVAIGAGGNPAAYGNVTVPIVKIYNTALSANQVKQNYNQYKSRFNLS